MRIQITSDDQLYNIKFWSRKFRESVAVLQSEGAPVDAEPVMVTAQISSLETLADEMDAEIARYEEEQRGRGTDSSAADRASE